MKSFISFFIIVCAFSCSQEKSDIEPSIAAHNIEHSEQAKINPVIPNSVEFRLIDQKGNEIFKDNVLCNLTYYIGATEYKIPYIKPEYSSGKVTFTRDEIINGAGLSDRIDTSLPKDYTPVDFELHVVNPQRLDNIEERFKSNMNTLKENNTLHSNVGINEEEAKGLAETSIQLLSEKQSGLLETTPEDIQVAGVWNSESEMKYDVVVN